MYESPQKVPELETCVKCKSLTFDGVCVTCSAREEKERRKGIEFPLLQSTETCSAQEILAVEKRKEQIRKIMLARKKRESTVRYEEGRTPIALQYLNPPVSSEDPSDEAEESP